MNEVIKRLLDSLEYILDSEFSSDGNEATAFARGWLGIPLPEKHGESPPRLIDSWNQGVKARNESVTRPD